MDIKTTDIACKTLCPKCSAYPFIDIEKEKKNEILINCDNCSYLKSENLQNYLTNIKENQNKEPNLSEKYNKSKSFCENCNKYILLDTNLNEHQNHKIIDLKKLIDTKEMKTRVSEGYAHIETYCKNLKDKGVTKIKNDIEELLKKKKELENNIQELEKAYESFKTDNSNILSFMNNIINNYENENNNYYLLKNVEKIQNIYIFKYKGGEDYKSIIKYFELYSFSQKTIFIDNLDKIQEIYGITDSIQTIIKLNDGKYAVCGYDESITIFNRNFDKILSIPVGASVNSICQLENGQILSCSEKDIKFWTVSDSTYVCDHTLETDHLRLINHVVPITKDRIVSVSYDGLAKVWENKAPYGCIATLAKHEYSVYAGIQIKGEERLITGGEDDMICIWDLEKYQLQTIIRNVECKGRNALLQINQDQIIIGGRNEIKIVDISSYQIIKEVKNQSFDSVYGLMAVNDHLFIFGTNLGDIGIYDKRLDTVEMKRFHEKAVLGFAKVTNNRFVSCSYDNRIKMFEY